MTKMVFHIQVQDQTAEAGVVFRMAVTCQSWVTVVRFSLCPVMMLCTLGIYNGSVVLLHVSILCSELAVSLILEHTSGQQMKICAKLH